jgi:hypothetical protein
LFPGSKENSPNALSVLDAEGPAVTIEFGRFDLISTYCPDKTRDTRPPYPMDYHLQSHIDQLEEAMEGNCNICIRLFIGAGI